MKSVTKRAVVKLTSAMIDEIGGNVIFRGILAPETMVMVQNDDYQREVLPAQTLFGLLAALEQGTGEVPDITLGMRGGDYRERDGAVYLHDTVYVIDGLQRLSAALKLIETGRNLAPHLGCIVYFNTTRESESALFKVLNTSRNRLSPNILLRNMRDESPVIEMLFDLTRDRGWVMGGRVSWEQRMKKGELITATTFIKAVSKVHSAYAPMGHGSAVRIAESLIRLVEQDLVSMRALRDNTRAFFAAIDEAWDIRNISIREGAAYTKGNFMNALALVMAHHTNFWTDNKRLVVPPALQKKLGGMKVSDPYIKELAGGNGASGAKGGHLYGIIRDHLNQGRGKLIPFRAVDPLNAMGERDGGAEDEEPGAAV